MMFEHRATLIQDVKEYITYLLPYLRPILERYAHKGVDEESVLLWIVEEELELIHCIFTTQHLHNHPVYLRIHDELNSVLPISLSTLTSQYIRAPKLYDDHQIQIKLHERDLYLTYYAPPPPFVQYVPQI